jgi:beta-phosphoglucomutase
MIHAAKAVIFDFNGTLFADSQFHNDAWDTFARLHGKSLTQNDIENHIHGFINKEILEFLFQRPLSHYEMDSFYEEKESIYRQICLDNPLKCLLTPGAEIYLDYLLENNIPRTIATASYLPNVNLYFQLFDLQKWFSLEDVIFDSGAYRGKPFPDLFLAAAEKIHVPISKCLVIEDSVGGIQAARNAGAEKIVAVNFDGNPGKFAQYHFIDSIISDFRQLILS